MTDRTIDPRVHAGENMYGGHVPEWREDGTCSYCGSLKPEDVVKLLRTPGSHFSGTDKGGYKFYVGDHKKFYGRHLRALADEALAEYDALSRKVFGVAWVRGADGETRCLMPQYSSFYGWQTWGDIGPDGEPVFNDGAPVPPDAAWWERALAARPKTEGG